MRLWTFMRITKGRAQTGGPAWEGGEVDVADDVHAPHGRASGRGKRDLIDQHDYFHTRLCHPVIVICRVIIMAMHI